MNAVVAWFLGAAYISYRYGYKCQMLPKPHRYIGLTAFISIAALVGMANSTVGALFAYGGLLGVYIYGQTHATDSGCDQITVTDIKSGQSITTGQKSQSGSGIQSGSVLAGLFPGGNAPSFGSASHSSGSPLFPGINQSR